MANNVLPRKWTVEDSLDLYSIRQWGNGYFSVNEKGNLIAQPGGPGADAVDLKELVEEVRRRGIAPPLLIRFSQILAARVVELNEAFRRAIQEYGYQGTYRGRLPDQGEPGTLRRRAPARGGAPLQLRARGGLASPSSSPCSACSRTRTPSSSATATRTRSTSRPRCSRSKLGRTRHPGGREVLRAAADRRSRRAARASGRGIGIRARLSTRGAGHWEASGGDRSKFGLGARGLLPGDQLPPRTRSARPARAPALPPRQPDRHDPQRQERAARGGALLLRAATSWARRSACSTSAAGWASTTTARRPTSRRR